MLIMAFSVITKTWKQPKCPSTDEWLNKLWYIHMMEFYSVTKQNKIMIDAIIQMNLKGIRLGARRQEQKAI